MGRLRLKHGKLVYDALPASGSRAGSSPAAPREPFRSGPPPPTAGQALGGGSRREDPKARAKARVARAAAQQVKKRFLKHKSVSEATQRRYAAHASTFERWTKSHGFLTTPTCALDAAFEAYFEKLYFDGAHIAEARYSFWGWGFTHDTPMLGAVYPRSYRALRGWTRAAPSRERDPMPWELVVIYAHEILAQGTDSAGPNSAIIARAMLVHFDMYCRPSELLGIQRKDVMKVRGKTAEFSILIAPQPDEAEGSHVDLARAVCGVGRPRGSKTGQFDDTVLLGDPPARRGDRSLSLLAMRSSLEDKKPADRVFPASLAEYNRALQRCAAKLEVPVSFTPHCLRHGGASSDYVDGARDIEAIRLRGRWSDPRSCARYKKPGKYHRALASIPRNVLERYRAAASALPGLLRS